MDAQSILARVRDRAPLTIDELQWFAKGLASGAVSDAQAGAFAMATVLRGLSEEDRAILTIAMRDSGQVIEWNLPGPVIDKHSTGGVGDCVSIVLAPALAACGAYVPMVSGRGLGHTGGTLDKLEAIPGVSTTVSTESLKSIVADCGCIIAGASNDIAPADRRLYAVRDVTATVPSIDLICASILSKKLAVSPDVLILDVKCGTGAFMTNFEEAKALAEALVTTGNNAGCRTEAIISDMSQPLAPSLGNSLEIAECMRVLNGARDAAPRLRELVVTLGGRALASDEMSEKEAESRISRSLDSGKAMERFAAMIAALGGPMDFCERWRDYLPGAPVVRDVIVPHPGYLKSIDGQELGRANVTLGAGRKVETDRIDYSVGISAFAPLGRSFSPGDRLCCVHVRTEDEAQAAAKAILEACEIGERSEIPPLTYEWDL